MTTGGGGGTGGGSSGGRGGSGGGAAFGSQCVGKTFTYTGHNGVALSGGALLDMNVAAGACDWSADTSIKEFFAVIGGADAIPVRSSPLLMATTQRHSR